MSPGARPFERWLVVSCVCALAALALMTWQIFDPTVWPVIVAMSLGQVLGTASFAMFGYVVFATWRAGRRAASGSMPIVGGELPAPEAEAAVEMRAPASTSQGSKEALPSGTHSA
jgi:hypothetical protein